MSKLISIGEVLIDFIPMQKGVKLKDVLAFERVAGGAPANVAACVAKLGKESFIISKIGEDAFGDYLIEVLNKAGVDTKNIVRTAKANTALAFVSLTSEGERDFSFYRNPSADMLLSPDEIDEALFERGDVLHFCSVDLIDAPVKKAHLKAIEYAEKNGTIISFDPNVRLPLWNNAEECRKTIREFIPIVDILKVSDDELEFITGIEDEKEAIESLFIGKVKVILYTKGRQGAGVFTRYNKVYEPAFKIDVVDTTGAGDSFIGAFIYQLLCRNEQIETLERLTDNIEELRSILRFANAAGAIVASRKGALLSMPTVEEVKEFMMR